MYNFFWLVEIFYQFCCHRQDPIEVNTNKKKCLDQQKINIILLLVYWFFKVLLIVFIFIKNSLKMSDKSHIWAIRLNYTIGFWEILLAILYTRIFLNCWNDITFWSINVEDRVWCYIGILFIHFIADCKFIQLLLLLFLD